MKLISMLVLTLSFSAHAGAKSLSEIAEDFSKQGIGFFYQEKTSDDKPLLVKKTDPAEIAFALYQNFGDGEIEDLKTFTKERWEDSADQAWESDGSMYGATAYARALSYVEGGSWINDTDKDAPEYKRSVEIFKEVGDLKNLVFIVAPVGAAPCGDVTLPAVLIIDTKSGEVFHLSMDSSEC